MTKKLSIEECAENFVQAFEKGAWISDTDVPFGFPFGLPTCLREIAQQKNKDLFQRVIDSYLNYSQKKNEGKIIQEHIEMESLSFIEFQCVVGDTGRMTIGIPGDYRYDGPARKMLLDLYTGRMPEDKGYTVKHDINV
ncbi:hypothetical protein J4456_00370 [Candidatus Pacearchaeota archaeon]|nr:hypothetical protein [Candidatus Pacearchaeota archaeon]